MSSYICQTMSNYAAMHNQMPNGKALAPNHRSFHCHPIDRTLPSNSLPDPINKQILWPISERNQHTRVWKVIFLNNWSFCPWNCNAPGAPIQKMVRVQYSVIVCVYKKIPGSTAQSGDGGFKNKKPIGAVRCCESWMAERPHRWIERWLERGPIYVSIYLPV